MLIQNTKYLSKWKIFVKKPEIIFRILKAAVLQDRVGGSSLVALCIFAVFEGESCRTGRKSPPPGETSGLSWTGRQDPWGGEWHVSHEVCPVTGDQGPSQKAKLFFRGKGRRRTVPRAAPLPSLVPHCTLRDSTAISMAPRQEGVPAAGQVVRRAVFRCALPFLVWFGGWKGLIIQGLAKPLWISAEISEESCKTKDRIQLLAWKQQQQLHKSRWNQSNTSIHLYLEIIYPPPFHSWNTFFDIFHVQRNCFHANKLETESTFSLYQIPGHLGLSQYFVTQPSAIRQYNYYFTGKGWEPYIRLPRVFSPIFHPSCDRAEAG